MLYAAFLVAASEGFRGNTNSHVFHQSSCRYYTCKNCTAKFATAAEAIENGYRPCGICEPGDSAAPKAKSSDSRFSGNTNTHKFHKASCRYATCKNCTAKFETRQEAIDAGYAPGGCCDP